MRYGSYRRSLPVPLIPAAGRHRAWSAGRHRAWSAGRHRAWSAQISSAGRHRARSAGRHRARSAGRPVGWSAQISSAGRHRARSAGRHRARSAGRHRAWSAGRRRAWSAGRHRYRRPVGTEPGRLVGTDIVGWSAPRTWKPAGTPNVETSRHPERGNQHRYSHLTNCPGCPRSWKRPGNRTKHNNK